MSSKYHTIPSTDEKPPRPSGTPPEEGNVDTKNSPPLEGWQAKPDGVVVPRLRFPEFCGTGDWEIQEISKFAKITTGAKDTQNKVEGGKYPFFVRSQTIERIDSYSYDGEAVLTSGDGVGVGKNFHYINGKFDFHQRVYSIYDFTEGVSGFFFFLYFSENFGERVMRMSAKNSVDSVRMAMIAEMPVLLPSLSEQQKIAACLSSVDELIAAQARKVDALKAHKKGLMQELFPREGETQPRLRFPEFQSAGKWEEKPLSEFVISLDAGVSVNSGDSRPAEKTEFGVLKTSAITKGQFDPEENKVVLAESELSRLREPVTGGTIIMCRKNTPALVGANAYVESTHENLFLPDLLWAAKPREGFSMRFLAFILGSDKGRAALSKLAKGSSASMSNITKSEVLAFLVLAPSPAEQKYIASCLSSLDDRITAETQKLENLKTHKKGLMQQLFPSFGGVARSDGVVSAGEA